MNNSIFRIALMHLSQPLPPEEDEMTNTNLTDEQIKKEADTAIKANYISKIKNKLFGLIPSDLSTIGTKVVEAFKPGLGAEFEKRLITRPLNKMNFLNEIERLAYLEEGSLKDTVVLKFKDNPTQDPKDIRIYVAGFLDNIKKLITKEIQFLKRVPKPIDTQKGLAVPPSGMV